MAASAQLFGKSVTAAVSQLIAPLIRSDADLPDKFAHRLLHVRLWCPVLINYHTVVRLISASAVCKSIGENTYSLDASNQGYTLSPTAFFQVNVFLEFFLVEYLIELTHLNTYFS